MKITKPSSPVFILSPSESIVPVFNFENPLFPDASILTLPDTFVVTATLEALCRGEMKRMIIKQMSNCLITIH